MEKTIFLLIVGTTLLLVLHLLIVLDNYIDRTTMRMEDKLTDEIDRFPIILYLAVVILFVCMVVVYALAGIRIMRSIAPSVSKIIEWVLE